MRRFLVLAVLVLVLSALAAGAETLRIEKEQLAADPADPSVVRFSVDIGEPGSYQVRLLVRGESEREIRLDLALQPEAGGPARPVHFSFTGQGCG
jgi:hypothetical protein